MNNNINSDFFIDVAFSQTAKHTQEICGDVYLTRKISAENRTIAVLSDGLGSGIKANILASMTASMALNFTSANSPLAHAANIIMNTIPIDKERKISFSSFTIIDIEADGLTHIIEYGNPEAIHLRGNNSIKLKRDTIKIENKYKLKQELYYSQFNSKKEDRIIVCSDGVTQSGIGSNKYPFGWNQDNLNLFIRDQVKSNEEISSTDLSKKLLTKSVANDAYKAKDDITAGVIYLREPRKLMLCTGPPYNEQKDALLAENLENFQGTKIICGGTTANIIARELNLEIHTQLSNYKVGLPPASKMENIDLVTEGILTIGRTLTMLEEGFDISNQSSDPASELCRHFLNHDEIRFIVGTKVNEAHQDPALPIELEIRRNVVKKIANCLDEKYLRKTSIEYI